MIQATQSTAQAAPRSNEAVGERKKGNASRWVIFVGVLIIAIFWLIPLAWALDTAFKPESETTNIPISWIPSHFTPDAFARATASGELLRWYFNSTLTSALITVLTVFLASMAAFAFSRMHFRSRKWLFGAILVGIMVPSQILIVPLFTEMQSLGMVNTYWGIILPQIASPIAVFIFKQFFDALPAELEEAAVLDGASRWRIYWQLIMPLAQPAVAAVAVFTFVTAWNNFIWPFIIVTSTDMMTIPVGLATVQTSYGIHYAQIMATAILGGLPVLIVFLFFQRQIVQGIAGTGLKG